MGWTLLFAVAALVWLGSAALTLFHLQWVHRLPGNSGGTRRAEHGTPGKMTIPKCSAVIAARDEASRIEKTVRHLLAQRNVKIEVIVVNDRSSDGTGEILARLAREDARVHLHEVTALPEGWLGKCHACHVGARAAKGEWILFIDADCWLKPDVLASALETAHREKADHIALSPGVARPTAPARAWHLAFLVSLADWLSRVNRDRPGAHVGIGAFNLVRMAAYRKCGGYEALRLTVVDDLKLGLLLHRAGFRSRGYLGAGDVECHWGTTVPEMIKIMEKNAFAILDFRLWLLVAAGLFAVVMGVATIAGLFSGTAIGMAAGCGMFLHVLPAAIIARRIGWAIPAAFFMPFMYPLMFYTLANSAWVTLRQGGIRWRDTFYPLEMLRAGNVR